MMYLRHWALVVICTACLFRIDTATAGEVSVERAVDLFVEGDVDGLHRAFAAHQATFDAGDIDGVTYVRPYAVFIVSTEARRETIDAWRTAYPDDPAALAASGAVMQALWALHGHRTPAWDMRPRQRARNREYHRAAARLYADTLRLKPNMLFAARQLDFIGPTSESEASLVAVAIRQHAPPITRLKHDLITMIDAGQETAAVARCRDAARRIPGMTLELCSTYVLMGLPGAPGGREVLNRVIAVLEKDEHAFFAKMHMRALVRAGRWHEAIAFAEEHGLFLDSPYVMRMPPEDPILWQAYEKAHRLDPENPSLLIDMAMGEAMRDNDDAARVLQAEALKHGKGVIQVHRENRKVMMALGDWHTELAMIEQAIIETENDGGAWLDSLATLLSPSERIALDADFIPHESYECRKRNILRRVGTACEAEGFHHLMCTADRLAAVQDALALLEDRDYDCSAAPALGPISHPIWEEN